MATPPVPPPKPRRWLRRFVVFLAILGVGLWFSPTIATITGAPKRIIRDAAADLNGTVEP